MIKLRMIREHVARKGFWCEGQKEEDYWEDIDVIERIMLKWIFET